jgi:hypothetical protein
MIRDSGIISIFRQKDAFFKGFGSLGGAKVQVLIVQKTI